MFFPDILYFLVIDCHLHVVLFMYCWRYLAGIGWFAWQSGSYFFGGGSLCERREAPLILEIWERNAGRYLSCGRGDKVKFRVSHVEGDVEE